MKRIVVAGCGMAGASVSAHLTRISKAAGLNTEVVLLDPRPPLTGSSQYSTECYRNFFTDEAAVPMMQRSIEIMEEMDRTHNLQMGRRGYLFVATKEEVAAQLVTMAEVASGFGAGELRYHDTPDTYSHSPAQGLKGSQRGFDIVRSNPDVANKLFPYLNADVSTMVHCREAGWLDATGLGSAFISEAKKNGAKHIAAELRSVNVTQNNVSSVVIEKRCGTVETIECDAFVNASGAWVNNIASKIEGCELLPISNTVISKTVLHDPEQHVPSQHCPFVFWKEDTKIEWSEEMVEALTELDDTDEGGIVNTKEWLKVQPSGQHLRPMGNNRILILWEHAHTHLQCGNVGEGSQGVPQFPPTTIEYFKELAVHGAASIVPKLSQYCGALTKETYQDAGYYCVNTEDARPIVTQHGPENAFVLGALGGWGVMSSSALGELCAKTVLQRDLPEYAGAFSIPRLIKPVGGNCPMR